MNIIIKGIKMKVQQIVEKLSVQVGFVNVFCFWSVYVCVFGGVQIIMLLSVASGWDVGIVGILRILPYTHFSLKPSPFCFLAACVAGGKPFRQGHEPVQPLSGGPLQELHRLLLRRAATHRQLPSAQDHWQGKLC